MIPANRLDPVGSAGHELFVGAEPHARQSSGLNNFAVTYPWWTKYHNVSERVDFNASDKLRMFARYSWFRTRLDNDNASGDNSIAWPSDNGGIMDATSSGIDALYMMSPRTTIDVKLGVNYTEDDYNSQIYKLKMGTPARATHPAPIATCGLASGRTTIGTTQCSLPPSASISPTSSGAMSTLAGAPPASARAPILASAVGGTTICATTSRKSS